jgi:thiol-disulfide isomerase/thioredoxin
MKYLAATTFLFLSLMVMGQDGYEIKVTLKPFKNEYIFLGHYNGQNLPVIDSARVNEKSEAVFKGNKKLGGGIYLIGYPDKSRIIEFLLDKNQKFSIIADTANTRNVAFINSPENIAFRNYQNDMITLGQEMDALIAKRNAAKTKADSLKVGKEIDAFNKEIRKYRTDIMQKDSASMLATLLRWMREPEVPENDPAAKTDSLFAYHYYKAHYWDDTYFFDDRLTRTPFFENKLDRYLDQMLYPSPDSVIKEMDWMMAYASASPEMEKFLLLKFINRYYNQKYMWEDKVFVHLYEKYIANKTYDWMSDNGKKMITDRAYSLMANIMGNPAPEIELPDTAGKKQTLYGLQSQYTLVAIWDPTCGHCKETLPKIDSVYRAKWKAEGLKVFALAKETEGKKEDWTNFINQHKLNDWIHVYASKASEKARVDANTPSYSQLYDVQSFPTLYLLDKDKRIIAKKLSFEQVDEILQQRIKTGK